MNDSSSRTLVDERDALSVYFEALLAPASEPVQVEVPPVEAPPVHAPPAPVTEVPAPAVPEPQEQSLDAASGQIAAQRPAWGEHSFQAMLFRVAGLSLAVPLVELNGVEEWHPDRVTPLPGHVAWYLGLTEYRGRNAPVVDTAYQVLPPDRLEGLTPAEERIGRIVFIGNGEWGLACDEVNEVITLAPDQVRWRTSRTRRSWLAGTVIEHMCALIDPPAFARMLATGVEDLGEEYAGSLVGQEQS